MTLLLFLFSSLIAFSLAQLSQEQFDAAVIFFDAVQCAPSFCPRENSAALCASDVVTCQDDAVRSIKLPRLRPAGNPPIDGSLPTEIGLLSLLTSLEFQDTQANLQVLRGTFPTQLGKLTALQVFDAGTNHFSGVDDATLVIPSEIGLWSAIEEIDLHNVPFHGTVPTEVGRLSTLKGFSWGGNNDIVAIPSEIYSLTSLTRLIVQGSYEMRGTLPSGVGQLTNLENLAITDTKMNGTLPTQLGSLTKLTSLSLRDNEFVGSIPGQLILLDSLHFLSLSDNKLYGGVPALPSSLTDCRILEFDQTQAKNCFSSCITPQICCGFQPCTTTTSTSTSTKVPTTQPSSDIEIDDPETDNANNLQICFLALIASFANLIQ